MGAAIRGPAGLIDLGNEPLTIGRSRENRLTLTNSQISSRHAEIQPVGGGRYQLVDLGSTNGTAVNGTKLAPRLPQLLSIGDTITLGGIGGVELRLESTAADGAWPDQPAFPQQPVAPFGGPPPGGFGAPDPFAAPAQPFGGGIGQPPPGDAGFQAPPQPFAPAQPPGGFTPGQPGGPGPQPFSPASPVGQVAPALFPPPNQFGVPPAAPGFGPPPAGPGFTPADGPMQGGPGFGPPPGGPGFAPPAGPSPAGPGFGPPPGAPGFGPPGGPGFGPPPGGPGFAPQGGPPPGGPGFAPAAGPGFGPPPGGPGAFPPAQSGPGGFPPSGSQRPAGFAPSSVGIAGPRPRKSTTRTVLLLVGGLLVVALLVVGVVFVIGKKSGSGTPTPTPKVGPSATAIVGMFYDDLKKQDDMSAAKLFTSAYIKQHGGIDATATLLQGFDQLRGKVTNYTIGASNGTNSSQTVTVQVTRDPAKGKFDPDQLQLVLPSGATAWQISNWTPGKGQG